MLGKRSRYLWGQFKSSTSGHINVLLVSSSNEVKEFILWDRMSTNHWTVSLFSWVLDTIPPHPSFFMRSWSTSAHSSFLLPCCSSEVTVICHTRRQPSLFWKSDSHLLKLDCHFILLGIVVSLFIFSPVSLSTCRRKTGIICALGMTATGT